MPKLYKAILAAIVLTFAAPADADDTKQQGQVSQGPDLSGMEIDKPYTGRLEKSDKWFIALMAKHDAKRAAKFKSIITRKSNSIDRMSSLFTRLIKALRNLDAMEKLYRDGILQKSELKIAVVETHVAQNLLNNTYGIYYNNLEEKLGKGEKRIRETEKLARKIEFWNRKFVEMRKKSRLRMGLPATPLEGIDLEFEWFEYKEDSQTDKLVNNAPPIEDKASPSKDGHYAVDDVLNRTEIIKTDPARPAEDRKIDANGEGEWVAPSIMETFSNGTDGWTSSDGPASLKMDGGALCVSDKSKGWLTLGASSMFHGQWGARGGKLSFRVKADDGPITHDLILGISGPGGSATHSVPANRLSRGAWTSISVGLDDADWDVQGNWLELTQNITSFSIRIDLWDNDSRGETNCIDDVKLVLGLSTATEGKSPVSASKTDGGTGVTTTSAKNSDGSHTVTKTDMDGNALSKETVSKSPASASSTDNETGVTTTSVRNSDGTHTVTTTDKNGKVLSEQKLGKSPASASSTDKKTGITTQSVRNSDGTHTVTRTDSDGNVLSSERVEESPDSASSTIVNTGETTKSIANPDGSRTVIKTDKDGNIVSREKVR